MISEHSKIIIVLMCSVFLLSLFKISFSYSQETIPEHKTLGVEMKIESAQFSNNQMIPAHYTCQGDDINPPLVIGPVSGGVKTLALIVDDPDAPGGTWVHWVVFNIPPPNATLTINEDSVPGKQGMNSWGKSKYGGPCPPSGTHRYFFKVYTLDSQLNLKEGSTKQQLEEAMKGHVIDQAELIGLYKKS